MGLDEPSLGRARRQEIRSQRRRQAQALCQARFDRPRMTALGTAGDRELVASTALEPFLKDREAAIADLEDSSLAIVDGANVGVLSPSEFVHEVERAGGDVQDGRIPVHRW